MAIDITGIGHVVLKVRRGRRTRRATRWGSKPLRLTNHRVSQSIYLNDPDGDGLELYVDADPAIWRENPAAVAHVEPLEL
jgi:catechol 2,3-dioxygenase